MWDSVIVVGSSVGIIMVGSSVGILWLHVHQQLCSLPGAKEELNQ
jgi:hypothetical protein